MKNPINVTDIEVVLEDIRVMKQIEKFPNIRNLTLIKTNIGQIEVYLFFYYFYQKRAYKDAHVWKIYG